MIDRLIEEGAHGRRGKRRQRAVDGLVVDERFVWLVLDVDEVDTIALLFGDAEDDPGGPAVICHRVEGDHVVIGTPDLSQVRLLSQWLAEDDADRA